MDVAYLDNNATTQVDPAVLEAMLPYLGGLYGNPSSMHSFGGQVAKGVGQAREQVAQCLGCEPGEVVFTSCGTESDNTAIRSALAAHPDRKRIITTKVEHPAVLSVFKHLEKAGYEAVYLSVDSQGRLDMDELRQALTRDTALVSVMYANNETGNIFPVPEIGAMCREFGVVFHTDAVQAVGKIPLSMRELPADYLAISGHKLHAPKGIGALYVRKGARFTPFMLGGHQEHGRRAGTESVASIVALGKACELAQANIGEETSRVKELRDRLERELTRLIPDTRLNGHPTERLPNTVNLSFKYVEGEAILLRLDTFGVCASSGSACTSGSLEPSHVLRAMGVPFTYAHGSIRFSLSRFNTEADVDVVIRELPGIISTLRAMSPYSRDTDIPEEAPACTVDARL